MPEFDYNTTKLKMKGVKVNLPTVPRLICRRYSLQDITIGNIVLSTIASSVYTSEQEIGAIQYIGSKICV